MTTSPPSSNLIASLTSLDSHIIVPKARSSIFMNPPQSPPLTSLPFEVRTLIYHSIVGPSPPSVVIFYNDITHKINRRTSTLPTAWLRTCRLIHAEGWNIIAQLCVVTWCLQSIQDGTPLIPRNQLSDILSSTFTRRLRSLEVLEGMMLPGKELLELWGLRMLVVHVSLKEEREMIRRDGVVGMRGVLDEEKAIVKGIEKVPKQARDVPFLRARTQVFVRLKAEFWQKCGSWAWGECRGFCLCMVRPPFLPTTPCGSLSHAQGLKFEMACRKVTEKDVWIIERSTSDSLSFSTWPRAEAGRVNEKVKAMERSYTRGRVWPCGCGKQTF